MAFTHLIATCNCSKKKKRFGLVIEKTDRKCFSVLHAFLLGENYPSSEINSESVSGTLELGDGYNGCKFCGSMNFFQCATCNEFSCLGSKRIGVVTCGNCGASGVLSGSIERFFTKND